VVSWHELNKGSVAYLSGSKRLRKKVDEDNRVPVSTSIQALEMLARNRVRAVVMYEAIALDLISQHSLLLEKLLVHQQKIDSFDLFTYIHKDHAELVPLLEKALRKIKHNGAYQKISDKYHFSMPKLSSEN